MGDDDFAAFYDAERPGMLRLARLLLGSDATVEDVVQEAFLRLRARPRQPENMGGYLRTVVVNLCKDQRRRLGLERQARGAAQVAAREPEIDETWAALHRLPFHQRAVLVLRFYEDLSEAEIGRVLDCRTGTVKSRLHRGLARLRRELSE
jgi:RNA polymerase sigma-70 factor (sigma-E family)